MNIKQLNEVFSIYSDGRFKYADIDAKAVYDNCINKDFGSHTFEEANEFKKFVNITPETDEEQLRALRNTLVKYWADYVKEYKGDDWGRSRSKEESDKEFKMGDQMQFFTTVIDMTIDNLPENKRIQESLNEDIDVDKQKLKDLMFKYLDDIDVKAPNYYKKQLKVDKEHKDYIDVLTVEIAKDYLKGMDLQAPLQAQFDVEHVLTDNFEKWLSEYQAQFNESKNEEYKITNKDRVDAVKDDAEDLQKAIESICNKFEFYSKKWDDEKQQNFADRIMEIMETAETNLKNVIKRMK